MTSVRCPVVGREPRVDVRDALGEPTSVRERDEEVVLAVPEKHRRLLSPGRRIPTASRRRGCRPASRRRSPPGLPHRQQDDRQPSTPGTIVSWRSNKPRLFYHSALSVCQEFQRRSIADSPHGRGGGHGVAASASCEVSEWGLVSVSVSDCLEPVAVAVGVGVTIGVAVAVAVAVAVRRRGYDWRRSCRGSRCCRRSYDWRRSCRGSRCRVAVQLRSSRCCSGCVQ